MKIYRNHLIYAMSRHNPPVAFVESGATVVFETCDCFSDQITSPTMTLDRLDWDRINPATGPLFIQGASPGDTLEVHIKDIVVNTQAAMVSGPGMGLGGEQLQSNRVRILPVRGHFLHFSEAMQLPMKPMIGVIGTAPSGDPVSNGTPGPHGGNMDTRVIVKGSTLYLPVAVEGALLAMGDLHAVMGDGEISVCGGEIAGEVTVQLRVIKGQPYPLPFLADKDHVYTIHSAETLDAAADQAAKSMIAHLESKGMDPHDAISLLSLVGNLQVSQIVDPLKTARFAFPRIYYDQL